MAKSAPQKGRLASDKIRGGDVCVDANPPKRAWRLRGARNGSMELVRVDKSTVFRFVLSENLRDPRRYVFGKGTPSWLRERATAKFRSSKSLQKFASIHASVHNHFNQDRHLNSRKTFKLNRASALTEWQQLVA